MRYVEVARRDLSRIVTTINIAIKIVGSLDTIAEE